MDLQNDMLVQTWSLATELTTPSIALHHSKPLLRRRPRTCRGSRIGIKVNEPDGAGPYALSRTDPVSQVFMGDRF